MTQPNAHYLAPTSLSLEQTRALFELARDLKRQPIRTDLAGRALGLIFFNPSLRTRSSFDIGMAQLGGHALTLDVGVGTWKLEHREDVVMDGDAAEHIKDAARVLSRYADALAIRSFPQRVSWGEDRRDPILSAFARWAEKPVINLESALHHPCQSLADLLTIEERLGDPKGQPIVISWAWHPKALPMAVPNSILTEAAKFGMDVRLAHPPGWELDPEIMDQARGLASAAGGRVEVHHDLETALPGARVVYAKSWGSIPNYRHAEGEDRAKEPLRSRWRIRMRHLETADDAFFMHCLPVRRGVIVDDEVLDSPRNAAYDEAENRLHVQKALLLHLLGKAPL
ncbi:MAG: N-acetylornithine carbamoyltransferase [Deltaproteobacteria bacterium]|nr:MAG: N-acetylornithine carbamoyltransferase [Deltaproteobacteria bacterium]